MKTIIDGKLYNTETAKQIDYYHNGLSPSDFNWLEETLYQKKTGEFFIHGEGGAMSYYSRSCGNNSCCGGNEIRKIDIDEAKDWLETYSSVEIYESVFGTIEE